MRFVRVGTATAVLTAAWLLAYGPSIPGGFIKDDFSWIHHGRLTGWSSVAAAFTSNDGFYRPLVRLSFGVTEALFGANPIPYSVTNIALGLACAGSIFALGRALGLAAWAALLAAGVWAFNFHGINMAVVWLSGRTSLLSTLFVTLAALALLRNRAVTAGLLFFAALLSKEEVFALPVILTLWLMLDRRNVLATLGMWIAIAAYLLLRSQSGAFGIGNAPEYYRLTIDPLRLWANVVEYADRSMTVAALVTIVAMLLLARVPKLEAADWRLLLKSAAWLVGGFAVTIWLPVRSSLYAVLPSVGAALACAVIVAATARNADPVRSRRVAAAALVLPFLLLPVYWSRNVRWTELRDLTNATVRAIQANPPPSHTLIVLEDDVSTRANFRNAFGSMFPEAAALHFPGRFSLWIEPPPPEVDAALRPTSVTGTVTFRLVNGRVEARRDFGTP
jgi:hypothetical protein